MASRDGIIRWQAVGVLILVAMPTVFAALESFSRESPALPRVAPLADSIRAKTAALPEALDMPAVEQMPQPPPVPRVRGRQATANEALRLAAQDLWLSVPYHEQPYQRYIWIRDGRLQTFKAIALALNYISTAPTPYPPVAVGKDRLLLARVDVRNYSSPFNYAARQSWIDAWEELRFEPALNLLFTRDTLKFNFGVEVVKQKKRVVKEEWDKQDVPPYKADDGQTYTKKWVKREVVSYVDVDIIADEDVLRQVNVDAVDPDLVSFLIDRTYSQAPLVTHGYFAVRSLRTLQQVDKGKLFQTLLSGLYNKFKFIPQNSKKGTDEDNLFAQLGIGDVKAGITADRLFERGLASRARVYIDKSGVTERERICEFFWSLTGEVTETQPLITQTLDLDVQTFDLGDDLLANLLRPRAKGKEIIYTDANGFPGFFAANGDGKILDQVPDTVIAGDRSTPHNTVLEAGISCIRCHGTDRGLRTVRNDIRKVTGAFSDIFGDFSRFPVFRPGMTRQQQDEVSIIFALYKGDPELKTLPRARNDLGNAYVRVVGQWEDKPGPQLDIVSKGSAAIAEIFDHYLFDGVTAVDALRDLGIEPDGYSVLGARIPDVKAAGEHLGRLLPPLPGATVYGIDPEDPRIALLKGGGVLERRRYALVEGFIAARVAIGKRMGVK